MQQLTEYNDVNKVLDLLSTGLQSLLGDNLVGLYLTGSLTYGGFNSGSSDIDFLAVLNSQLTDEQFTKIEVLHSKIAEQVPHWAKSLEGSYITKAMLSSTDNPKAERPYVNGGRVVRCAYGNEWVINLYALQECGKLILGEPLDTILPRVTIDKVRQASKKDMLEDWTPKIEDPKAFKQPLYDSEHLKNYAVLTMCRILHRAKNDNMASKKAASQWTKEAYPQWKDLIERAEQWEHGKQMGDEREVKNFMKFTLAEL
ncbi:MAG: hypothetical protein QG553_222 [Patescibacteria group bacterium]|nr:hypothetical protein [Patescibacteria group bacterium]